MTSSTPSLSRDKFEEFYVEWHPRAVRAARKRGLLDPEGVASDIMLVFLEKDYLDRYDPTRDGAASVESWVNAMIYNRLNNAWRDESRQALGNAVEWLDHDEADEFRPFTEFKMLALSCFELLRDRYGMELAEVWVSIVKQVAEDSTSRGGRARQWMIAKHLKVGSGTVTARMRELRRVIQADAELREMLSADTWEHAAA